MKARLLVTHASIGLLFLMGCVSQGRADITVRLSVKFILRPDGTRPSAGEIGTTAGFDAEITRANQILAATGRGYKLHVDYPGPNQGDIRPPVPSGEASDYWFTLPARENRDTIEAAAVANLLAWQWNASAINIYVNNSGSGQCSLVGDGLSISLGNDIVPGTVLHEVGHFFDLKHTHSAADNDGTIDDWGDGDGFVETLDDDPDASASDIDARYFALPQQLRDDLFFNVMSYHQEERFLPVQMNLWTLNANEARLAFCSGRTWFVASGGSDGESGASAGLPFATVARALFSVGSPDDVVLLRPGIYAPPPGNLISTACTLRATGGPIIITGP